MMKALSIQQPWAWLIVNGPKDIENRTWYTPFRGRVYVHAGKKALYTSTVPDWERFDAQYWASRPGLGAIVGEVDIVDCVKASDSPWFQGPYGFVLANPVAYAEPIPCRGRLGFFEPDLITTPRLLEQQQRREHGGS